MIPPFFFVHVVHIFLSDVDSVMLAFYIYLPYISIHSFFFSYKIFFVTFLVSYYSMDIYVNVDNSRYYYPLSEYCCWCCFFFFFLVVQIFTVHWISSVYSLPLNSILSYSFSLLFNWENLCKKQNLVQTEIANWIYLYIYL